MQPATANNTPGRAGPGFRNAIKALLAAAWPREGNAKVDKISLNCLTFSSLAAAAAADDEDENTLGSFSLCSAAVFRKDWGCRKFLSCKKHSGSSRPHQLDKVANPLKWIGRSLFGGNVGLALVRQSEPICGTERGVFRTKRVIASSPGSSFQGEVGI